MPRPKKPGAAEPKRRSRNGCWPCKARKVKCGEEKPKCLNCERQGEACDYSIRLNWGGRTKRVDNSESDSPLTGVFSFNSSDSLTFPVASEASVQPPYSSSHARTHSGTSGPTSEPSMIDPELVRMSQAPPQSLPAVEGLSFALDSSSSTQRNPFQSTLTPFDTLVPNGLYRAPDVPSPSASNLESVGFRETNNYTHSSTSEVPLSPPSMLPPIRGFNNQTVTANRYLGDADPTHSSHNRSQSVESPLTSGSERFNSSLSASEAYSPNPGPRTPYSPFMATPLTPNSSAGSEDVTMRNAPKSTGIVSPSSDPRRLSVQSLLSGPPDDTSNGQSPDAANRYPIGDAGSITYGYDLGHPDLDTPKNDDDHAIAIFSPPASSMGFGEEPDYGSFEVRGKDMAFEKGGYYAKPVPIKISKSLGTLPKLLLENPMNLLYFHHFLNHTARILVPHDCEQNPFRQILPEMAMHDENIMHLLLAFSASHRARLLNHNEPANRIAVWVQDVFPMLRQALASSDSRHISNATLAPAIMLASLEIVSPNTFGVPISWQSHLTVARQMIMARGGPRSVHRQDRVAYFLSRWFAYLDVVGSLSGNKNDNPIASCYWSSENASADEDFEIDCLLGYTTRCLGILARIAELAKQCESKRIDEDGKIREDWRPEENVVAQANLIRHELQEGLSDNVVYKGCNHRSSDSSESEGVWDATEIYATNEMFHWAGLIHLYRRVLGKAAEDHEVQYAVREIVGLLYKVRKGSTAEACLLFPMFTAGCDAHNQGQREKIMERLRGVEGFGMTQVHKARSLMQRVWDTGKPWETLVSGEFFG